MFHTFVALVEDKPGVLTRVASLFRRLNINIVSLTVGESERPDTSRMTIVCDAHEHAAHRIRASLYKLETTVHVDEDDLTTASGDGSTGISDGGAASVTLAFIFVSK